ncbi:MAG: UDP-N-acetylmuramate--L-alanine ligase [Bdellovibrio sp.]
MGPKSFLQSSESSFKNLVFHFVGVGGIGMCGLAEILLNLGALVSGSDLQSNEMTRFLEKRGLRFFGGHAADHVGSQTQVVVVSTAIPRANPEIQRALELRIPVIGRAEALSEIMRLRRGIAVAGAHGKTTTTSLIASILIDGGAKPSVVVGGRVPMMNSTACWGEGDWLVAEADESDASFLRLNPEISVVTNIDDDHLDHYRQSSKIDEAFALFADRIPFYGCLVACGDNDRVYSLFKDFHKRVIFYGFKQRNELRIFDFEAGVGSAKSRWKLELENGNFLSFESPFPGEHHALNATAAFQVARLVGLPFFKICNSISSFQGVDRRFHFQRSFGLADIYDDYAHHPTEILATLKSFKEKFPQQRLLVLFQPHRYSRTLHSIESFEACFAQADELWIAETYAAGEKPEAGLDSKDLLMRVRHSRSQFLDASMAQEILSRAAQEKSILLLLGAGNINHFFDGVSVE